MFNRRTSPIERHYPSTFFSSSVKLILVVVVVLFSVMVLISAAGIPQKNYDAETVLKRIYHLSEFPDTSQTPQNYSIKGIAEHAGLTGEFTNLFDKNNGYLSSVDLGQLGFSQGFDGTEGWESNPNGIVSDISRLNEDLLTINRIVESREFLSASEDLLRRECLGPESFHDRGVYRFRLTCEDGIAGEALIDSLSGHVIGAFMQYDFVEAWIVYSDFHNIEGYSFAYHTELKANISDLDITTQATSCEVNGNLPVNALARPETNVAAVTFPVDKESIVLPLEYHQGHLYFRMSINGSEPRLFLLDSGAGGIALDAYHLESLGLETFGSQMGLGVAGSAEFNFGVIDEMNLEGITFKNQISSVLHLEPSLRTALRGIVGIVGYDFLSRFIVTVDYDRELMTIYPPTTNLKAEATDINSVMPLAFYLNLPVVEAKVNDNIGKFFVDIGNSYSALLHEHFAEVNALDDLPSRKAIHDKGYIGGVGGSLPTKAVTIQNFDLPDLEIQNQPAWIILGGEGASASTAIAGNIGNGFLDQYRVTFDYPHRRLILHNQTFD